MGLRTKGSTQDEHAQNKSSISNYRVLKDITDDELAKYKVMLCYQGSVLGFLIWYITYK